MVVSTADSRATIAAVRWRPPRAGAQILTLTARSVRNMLSNPKLLILGLLQPLIMLTIFSQVFVSVSSSRSFPQGVTYISYLLPAILVMTGIGAAMHSGIGLITEMRGGIILRLRSLPVELMAILIARSLADLVRAAIHLALVLVASALLFGFRPPGGVTGTLAAVLVALVVHWSMIWVFLALAARVRNVQTLQAGGYLVMMPLMFASSAYVPRASLPGWLGAVATANPLTYAVDASRHLVLGMPVHGRAWLTVGLSLAIIALASVAALRAFRKPLGPGIE
ncbi:ABC transporter permease [Micromonospora echinospora]|uniref:ABC transporter permease n=1 Tax=Micromonospora echinospora TaxID=1877 RepID=UPI003CE763B2